MLSKTSKKKKFRLTKELGVGLESLKWKIDISVLSSSRMEKQYTMHFLTEAIDHEDELF